MIKLTNLIEPGKTKTVEADQQVVGGRSRGDTTLGDVVVVRELDKSSVKL